MSVIVSHWQQLAMIRKEFPCGLHDLTEILPFLTGCEPMGLFWGLLPQEGSKPGLRLRKKDVMQPHHMTLSVLSGHVTATTSSCHEPSSVLCQTTLERHYAWEDVIRVPVREGRLRGTLFIPKSKSTWLNKCVRLNKMATILQTAVSTSFSDIMWW